MAEGADEEGQGSLLCLRQGEYIIMMVRGERERGAEMRSDGLEKAICWAKWCDITQSD